MLVFGLSVTPKSMLHALVANHKDTPITSTPDARIMASTFHCHADDLVVEFPFLKNEIQWDLPVQPRYRITVAAIRSEIKTRNHLFCQLRGPPAAFML
jgi:hypothetical protein